MIQLKIKDYTPAEARFLAELLNSDASIVLRHCRNECDDCRIKRVCRDINVTRFYLRKYNLQKGFTEN